MNPQPVIGVVIPLFNKRDTLERCIQSVLWQSLQPSRILVVDDGSTDGSVELATALLAETPSAEIVVQPVNGGPAKARNEGARRLDTDWIAFLDADDEWQPDFLERVATAAIETKSDFAASGRVHAFGGDGEADFLLPGAKPGAISVLDGAFWNGFPSDFPLNSSCNLISSRLFWQAGGFHEGMRQREDHALWTKLWSLGRFCFVNLPLARIEKSPSGLSRRPQRTSDLLRMELVLLRTLGRALRERRAGAGPLAGRAVKMGIGIARYLLRSRLSRFASLTGSSGQGKP